MAYTLKGLKCGTVRFEPYIGGTVNKETLTRNSTVTDNPIEDGGVINDHVVKNPEQFQISGVIVGGNAAYERLIAMWEKRDIIEYTGRMHIKNLVILSFQSNAEPKNSKGIGFSITLKKINTATSEYVPMGEEPLMSSQDSGKSKMKTQKTKADGLKTTVHESISSSAYTEYVSTYSNKPASSSGPTTRATPSTTGLS